MNNNSKSGISGQEFCIRQALMDSFTLEDSKNYPKIFEHYIKILGICGICKSKIFGEYPKDNICPQCKRNNKLNEILK
jgi:hypothetical protein